MDVAIEDSGDRARSRFERMYREIRRRICMLDYPPGMRLSEEAMAREFGVSRTPLRRVLGRLESEGLVQSLHGVGTMVTDPGIDELRQVYQLRLELAGLAGRLDPRLPTAAELAGFEALAARAAALVEAPAARGFCALNVDFFEAHVALVGNAPLREFTERLYYRTARIWLQSLLDSRIDLAEEARIFAREIDDFTAALKTGDMHGAAMIHRAHVSMSFTRMRGNAPA